MLTYLLKLFFKAVTNKKHELTVRIKLQICPIAILPLDFQFQHLLKGMRILIIEGEGIQIRIDEIKNIAKLSFNNFKASSPSKSPTLIFHLKLLWVVF
jgi:hypothetical protein